MCVLIFSTNFAWNISYSNKIWARYVKKCIVVLMWNTRYSCQILIKLQISRQTFEKYSDINFMKIRQVGAKMFHADGGTEGRRDGQRNTTKLVVAFRNFAKAPKLSK
jgi:hypothetical protein